MIYCGGVYLFIGADRWLEVTKDGTATHPPGNVLVVVNLSDEDLSQYPALHALIIDPSRLLTVSDNRIVKLKIYLNGASDGITSLSVHDADEVMDKYGTIKVNRCIYYNETYYRLINLYS